MPNSYSTTRRDASRPVALLAGFSRFMRRRCTVHHAPGKLQFQRSQISAVGQALRVGLVAEAQGGESCFASAMGGRMGTVRDLKVDTREGA